VSLLLREMRPRSARRSRMLVKVERRCPNAAWSWPTVDSPSAHRWVRMWASAWVTPSAEWRARNKPTLGGGRWTAGVRLRGFCFAIPSKKCTKGQQKAWSTNSLFCSTSPGSRLDIVLYGFVLYVIMTIALAVLLLLGPNQAKPGAMPVSAERSFAITLHAPMARACQAFGPVAEKQWSPHWQPEFISWTGSEANPDTAVFTTSARASDKLLWIMTAHDCKSGLVQYVNVEPGNAVTVLEIRCARLGKNGTRAIVLARKTALSPAASEFVRRF